MPPRAFHSRFGGFMSVIARFASLLRFENTLVEPLLCGFFVAWFYAHIGEALSRWMEARIALTIGAVTATSASWNVTVRA